MNTDPATLGLRTSTPAANPTNSTMTGVKHFTTWMNAKLREVSYTAFPTKALTELHNPTVRMAAVYVFHAFFAAPKSPRKPIKAHNNVPENLRRIYFVYLHNQRGMDGVRVYPGSEAAVTLLC